MPSSIKHTDFGPVTIISLSGRIDTYTLHKIEPYITQLIATKYPAFLLVSLKEVSFLDSSGIAFLVKLLKRCVFTGGNLSLLHVHSNIRSIFRTTNLDRVFSIYDNEDEAIRKITRPKQAWSRI